MFLIYISGIDGCGKTTQSKMLVETLQSQGHSVEYQWLRWEPSVNNILKALRNLLGKNSKSTASSIINNEKADTRWHKLKQRLMKSGLFRKFWLYYASNDYYRAYKKARLRWKSDIVIIDRYIFDFIADQSINFGVSTEEMEKLFSSSKMAKMHQPDLNIIIDISAETGFRRKMDGTSITHLKQREGIYSNTTGENTHHINGDISIPDIQKSILNWVRDKAELT